MTTMRRYLWLVLAAALLSASPFAYAASGDPVREQKPVTSGIIMNDAATIAYGSDLDVAMSYDEATDDRLEWTDAAGNLLMWLKDMGTTGDVGATGDLTIQGGDLAVGLSAVEPGDVVLHDAGTITMYDDGNNTSVVMGPVVDGGTTLPITGSLDVSGSVAAGTMTIGSGSITDTSGAISFGDENLSTTGTLATGATTINGILTVKPDGTNEVFQVNDGSLDFTDGNAGTTGTLTVDNAGNWTYNKNISAAALAEGANAVPNATDNLSFFASTTSVQLAGVISDETGSGALVFGTSPAFTTSITTPKVIGGTDTTSDLTLQTTSGVGTTGADMHFLVGNNGATEAMTILNNGNVGIGTTGPDAALEINHATGDSLRLTYNDSNGSALNYTDFSVSSTGNLTITPGTNASHVGIAGGQTVKKTNVADANYGTSALTQDYIVAFTSLTASRTATISTEDVESGTTTQPRVMIVKDESGDADTYPITIVLENGGTIDGQTAYSINQAYGSVMIYLNGTNGFCY